MKTQKISDDRYTDFRQEVKVWDYDHYVQMNLKRQCRYRIAAKWMRIVSFLLLSILFIYILAK